MLKVYTAVAPTECLKNSFGDYKRGDETLLDLTHIGVLFGLRLSKNWGLDVCIC
jgi:hypothetical protein